MKHLIFMFFVATAYIGNAQQTHTKVNFIHGMNGNSQSLTRIHNFFINLQRSDLINSTSFVQPVYHESALGIGYTAQNIADKIFGSDPYYYETPKKIVIAHSLGGLAARKWYIDYKMSTKKDAYNGIITLNSPHLGAHIASVLTNEVTRAKFDNSVKDAIYRITEGASSDSQGLLSEFVKDPKFQIIYSGCEFLGFKALNNFTNKIFGRLLDAILQQFNASNYIISNIAGSQKVLTDLSVGSTVINEINKNDIKQTAGTYDTKVFKIAINGIEKSPQVFRMFGSSFYADSKKGSYELFNHDNDDYLLALFGKLSATFDARIQALNPSTNEWWRSKGFCAEKKAKRDAWIRSKDYLENTFHTFFIVEMGLLNISTRPNPPILYPNDGLVTSSTQKGFPGAVPILIEETNHEEIKNSKETAYLLRAITNGSCDQLNRESPSHSAFFKLFKK